MSDDPTEMRDYETGWRKDAVRILLDQKDARIRELEAQLALFMPMKNKEGYKTTHVYVPVEPTLKMQKAGFMAKDRLDSTLPNIIGIYHAMIRAAQERG